MKIGRNAPCPCGSGKKYKRCCLGKEQNQTKEAKPVVLMDPNFTMDELNAELQRRMAEQKSRPNNNYCGLSSTQMTNWLSATLDEKQGVTITAPADLATSPVMRYLEVILDEAMSQGGSFKVTAKGNLPLKVVKQAQAVLPELAVASDGQEPSSSEFTGSNEERFNALHYARILAELAGIISLKSGRIHVSEEAQALYQSQGLKAFFLPMLEAVVVKYNWSYFDDLAEVSLSKYWLFMLWRLQGHCSITQLIDDVNKAFPKLAQQFTQGENGSAKEQLDACIASRFVKRFMQFWGFVSLDSKEPTGVKIQPLLGQTFTFSV